MAIEIEIPIPPSNNRYMGNSHSYHAYSRDKETVRWQIRAALIKAGKPKKPYERAIITLVYHFPDNRRRDPDNYSGKFILDALVREGVIRDDSFDCVRLRLEKGDVRKDRPCVEIAVAEEVKAVRSDG